MSASSSSSSSSSDSEESNPRASSSPSSDSDDDNGRATVPAPVPAKAEAAPPLASVAARGSNPVVAGTVGQASSGHAVSSVRRPRTLRLTMSDDGDAAGDRVRAVNSGNQRAEAPSCASRETAKRQHVADIDSELPPLLTLDSLQGRWRHSSAALGVFTFKGDTATFASGYSLKVTVRPDGILEASGWTTVAEKSCPDKIVWTNGASFLTWSLEDDGGPDAHGMDSSMDQRVQTILASGAKRRKRQVDYLALDQKMRAEELVARAKHLDDESSSDSGAGGGATGAKEATLSPRERAELNTKQAAAAVRLFEKWLLSTRTASHEERLKRRGSLSTTLPVRLAEGAQKMLEKELRVYGAQVAHREQGVVLIVDTNARKRFRDRHTERWRTEPLPAPKKQKLGTAALLAPSATVSVAAPTDPAIAPALPTEETASVQVHSTTLAPVTAPIESAAQPSLAAATPAELSSAQDVPMTVPVAVPPVAATPPVVPVVNGGGRLRRVRRVVADDSDEEGAKVACAAAAPAEAPSRMLQQKEQAPAAETPVALAAPVVEPLPLSSAVVVAEPVLAGAAPAPVSENAELQCAAASSAASRPTASATSAPAANVPRSNACADEDSNAAGVESAAPVTAATPVAAAPAEAGGGAERRMTDREAATEALKAKMMAAAACAKPAMAAREDPPASVEDAKARLDEDPPLDEISSLLAFLERAHMDAATLAQTKVGVAVNRIRKKYGGSPVALAATSLVQRWKALFNEERLQQEKLIKAQHAVAASVGP